MKNVHAQSQGDKEMVYANRKSVCKSSFTMPTSFWDATRKPVDRMFVGLLGARRSTLL